MVKISAVPVELMAPRSFSVGSAVSVASGRPLPNGVDSGRAWRGGTSGEDDDVSGTHRQRCRVQRAGVERGFLTRGQIVDCRARGHRGLYAGRRGSLPSSEISSKRSSGCRERTPHPLHWYFDDYLVRRGGRDHPGDARRGRARLVEEIAAIGRELRHCAVARQFCRGVELTGPERDWFKHGGVGGIEQPQIPGERRGVVAPLPGKVGDPQRRIRVGRTVCTLVLGAEEGDRQKGRGGERSSHFR